MLILGAEKGRVRRVIKNDSATPAMLTFPTFDFATLHAVVTSLSADFKPSYQVSDSLGDDIYLLSFGESVSPIRIAGMIFEDVCDEEADVNDEIFGVQEAQTTSGVESVIDWWEQHNLSRQTEPIQLTLGVSRTVQAFLAELQIVAADPRDKAWRFSMNLLRVPKRPENLDARFADVDGVNDEIFVEGGAVTEPSSEEPDAIDAAVATLPGPFLDSIFFKLPESSSFGSPALMSGDGLSDGTRALTGVISGQ